ncbi:hypothetical protein B5M44_04410 [Shinella sumterensis]|uniref:hypothetical protein n=1 Tax=Shinella sumterensis TaxID=1967501 RepID=UPI00106E4530|nr:hypothetical protein [Shinella sumterensis]MCD1264013.1 hypothetical protein [Shinella sumterensis]TFE99446.1 hypothetical protein B5M44_04410 [Shinella sumterensis]
MNDNNNTPLLDVERAIADNLDPTSLRMVADSNDRKGERRRLQAENLRRVADRLELLGYGRVRRAA